MENNDSFHEFGMNNFIGKQTKISPRKNIIIEPLESSTNINNPPLNLLGISQRKASTQNGQNSLINTSITKLNVAVNVAEFT